MRGPIVDGSWCTLPVGGLHLVPPVVADAVVVIAGELACAIALGRVDGANRHSVSCEGYGVGQAAVVGEHDDRVLRLGEHVDEEVCGEVDVGALLVAPCNRGHESGVGNVLLGSVLHHQRPLRVADNRRAFTARYREWHCGDSCGVVSVADQSD